MILSDPFQMDHDPRNPAYIITQGPMTHTVADFWQMVWEQGSVVIVMLSRYGLKVENKSFLLLLKRKRKTKTFIIKRTGKT